MLKIEHVSKKFATDFWKKDITVLDDVSFSIEEGSLTGFLGANGAGKTTLIKILLQFISKDSGTISYKNSEVSHDSMFFKEVGYVPERPYFYGDLTGLDFCRYMSSLHDVSRKQLNECIKKYGERLKIEFALNRKINGYSKGMLQRLGFLCALISDPKFIILDEPLSGLDPLGRKEFKDVLCEVNREGVTVFFSSHIVSDVEEISSDLVVLDSGRLIYNGTVDEMLKQNNSLKYVLNCRVNDESFASRYLQTTSHDTYKSFVFDEKDKNSLLKELHDLNGEIVSLERQKISLEQIIYNKGSNV